jgi:hypothetical protein
VKTFNQGDLTRVYRPKLVRYRSKIYTYRLSLFTKGRRLKVSLAKTFNQGDLTRAYSPKLLRYRPKCTHIASPFLQKGDD